MVLMYLSARINIVKLKMVNEHLKKKNLIFLMYAVEFMRFFLFLFDFFFSVREFILSFSASSSSCWATKAIKLDQTISVVDT